MEILDFKKDISLHFWKIGERLNKIKEDKLYLEKYHFFEEYLDKGVHFSRDSAYLYMRLASSVDMACVPQISLRRWDLLLPLKEEQREKVINIVKQIDSPVSDKEFSQIVSKVQDAPLIQDIPDKDYKEYWDLECLGKEILSKIASLSVELRDFNLLYEKCMKLPTWSKYPRQKALNQYKQAIIKEMDKLR